MSITDLCNRLDSSPVGPESINVLLTLLKEIRDCPQTGANQEEVALLGRGMHAFLRVFCSPLLSIPDSHALPFVIDNVLIGNVMAALGTNTDLWIQTLMGQQQSGFKTLVLYSARNNVHVDLSSLLCQNAPLVSQWLYCTFQVIFSGAPNKHVLDKLCSFVEQMDDKLTVGINIHEAYFGVTYTGNMLAERRLKELINQAVRKTQDPEIIIDPDPKRVAVWAEYWSHGHSVHRSLFDYIKALKANHHLTLIHSTRKPEELDLSLFDDIVHVPLTPDGMDVTHLRDAGFSAVVFCDIGMTVPSVFISNIRLAPVQVMLTGHPVSTFGGEIDYFLSGDMVEDGNVYGNNRFYSEKLLSLPGYGATHIKPTYQIKGKKKETDAVIINCSWYGQKVHHECLAALERAIKRSGDKVLVRIFSGNAPMLHKGAVPFMADVQKVLKSARVELYHHLPYEEYMEIMEEGDFAVDCFPFGGSNTASDSIHLGKPFISLDGNRWFNKIGPSMAENVFEYMPPDTVQEYEDEIASLISLAKIGDLTLQSVAPDAIYEPRGPQEFAEWMKGVTCGTMQDV